MKAALSHWIARTFGKTDRTDAQPWYPRNSKTHMARSFVRPAGRMLCENEFEELLMRRQPIGGQGDGGLQSRLLGTAYGQ